MAEYYILKCPHCKQTIKSGKNRKREFGSPLCRCRFCGTNYIDKNYIEAGLLTDKQLKMHVLFSYKWNILVSALSPFFFLALVSTGEIIPSLIGLAIFAVGFLLVIPTVRGCRAEMEDIPKIVAESNKRLTNPYYVIALHKAKISVPKSMLDRAEQYIVNKQNK